MPLSEIREDDMLQDPRAGNSIKVTHIADSTMSVTHKYSDREKTVTEHHRVYAGDGGEEYSREPMCPGVNANEIGLCRSIIGDFAIGPTVRRSTGGADGTKGGSRRKGLGRWSDCPQSSAYRTRVAAFTAITPAFKQNDGPGLSLNPRPT